MAGNLSIEEYRKQRKRKKLIKSALAFIVLLSVILATVFIWQSIAGKVGDKNKNFPVAMPGDLVVSSKVQGNNLAILTDKELFFYTMNGKKLRSVGHSYKSPALSETQNEVLLYDSNGTNFSVENFSKTLFSKSLNDKIYLGVLAKNGNIAIVTADARYACNLTIYDKKGDEIYKWFSAENLITSIEFTGNGSGCVLAATGVSESLSSTVVYGLDFSKKSELFHNVIGDSLPLGISKIGGFYHVVTDRSLEIIDQKGSVFNEVALSLPIRQYVFADGHYTVVLLGKESSNNSLVSVYDQNGNKVGEELKTSTVKRIASDGSHVLVLDDSNISVRTLALRQIKNYDNRRNVLDILCAGSVGFEISGSFMDKFSVT